MPACVTCDTLGMLQLLVQPHAHIDLFPSIGWEYVAQRAVHLHRLVDRSDVVLVAMDEQNARKEVDQVTRRFKQ